LNVVVLSPSVRSRYTAAVCWVLQQEGLTVRRVIVRRMLQAKRMRAEWRSTGGKLLTKIVRRALHIDSSAVRKSGESLAQALAAWGAPADLHEAGVPRLLCRDFNDVEVLAALENDAPSAVFFTGGGIIRRPVLERSGAGVVNCHMGPLPRYRGMDVVEWPVLHGEPCAVTCHFMDEGLDTGPILLSRPIAMREEDTFELIRVRAEVVMVNAMRDVAAALRAGTLEPRPQRIEEGRQYFRMHPRLLERAAERIGEIAIGQVNRQ
jgi:folate-dependent phosphoribosylglycinamide formyltransferase PurN